VHCVAGLAAGAASDHFKGFLSGGRSTKC